MKYKYIFFDTIFFALNSYNFFKNHDKYTTFILIINILFQFVKLIHVKIVFVIGRIFLFKKIYRLFNFDP